MPRKGKRAEAQKRRWKQGEGTGGEAAGQPTLPQSMVSMTQATAVPMHSTISASHSQADGRYGELSRNRQCTCNSLMFLAVLHERTHLNSVDLDFILEKGDLMYVGVRRKLVSEGRFVHVYLALDELPEQVTVNEHRYSVQKHLSRYGYLRKQGPDGAEDFLKLSERLHCLSAEVSYALLTLRSLTIALFRDQDGRYGFFDPHSRTPDGLPSITSHGTAVMMIFENLDDMTERLLQFHDVLQSPDNCIYEFMPVWITSTMGSEEERHSTCQSPQCKKTMSGLVCSTSNAEALISIRPSTSVKALTTLDPPNTLKLNKQRRRRKVLDTEQKYSMSREVINKQRHDEYYKKNKTNKLNKARHKYASCSQHQVKKRACIKERYSQDAKYQQRQKSYGTSRYSQDAKYRQNKKSYVTSHYSQDAIYRQRQKSFGMTRYVQDAEFQSRQKAYMKSHYACDSSYKKKKQQRLKERYQQDPQFRRHQILCSIQQNKYKYWSEDYFRMLQKVRCSLHIRRKYQQSSLTQKQNKPEPAESESPLIQHALSSFRMATQVGPTNVCTVCHRALFPNQVKVCKRERYKKNLSMVLNCLTGKYVHTCTDECSDQQLCSLSERRTEWICYCCHENLITGTMPSIAVMNKMELSPIPSELQGLNILERHIIARYIPFARIISLPKGQQRAIVGSLVCVGSEVETTVNALPRPSSQSQLLKVKLKRRMNYKGHYQYQTLDMKKVLDALSKLKDIHSEYKDILIRDDQAAFDQEVNSETDEDHQMNDISADIAEAVQIMENDVWDDAAESEEHHSGKEDGTEDTNRENASCQLDTCLQPADIAQELLTFGEGVFCVAPAEGNRPIGFFKVPKLEAMAFPVQFPTGENTLDEINRIKKLTPSRYFNARLLSVDNRFALDSTYIFFAQFVTELHLATSSMSIQLRKGKPVTRDGRKITAKMLQDKQEVERLVHNKDATRFMQPLRGTPAYWEKTLRDLFAMLRQLGTPTFFLTFSAAEMRWSEVIKAIKAQQGEQVNFAELDWATKCEILRSNAVTTMRMFEKRVDALLRHLLLSPAKPIGDVVDYFYRVEYQARGSPHIHLLVWCQNAPVFEGDSDKKVCDFVDSYISCQLPDQNKDPELFKIVSEVQTHSRSHSKSCKKGNKHCRFGFPKPCAENTFITRPTRVINEGASKSNHEHGEITPEAAKLKLKPVWELLNDPQTSFESLSELLAQCKLGYEEYKKYVGSLTSSSVIMVKRRPKDSWVNAYNKHLLRAWNANMDIQFILNPYSCIMYILSYISKAEHEMSDYLKRIVVDTVRDSTSDREEMKQIMQAYSKNREVSIQEAVARVCGLKLKSCSRSVVFIPTDDDAFRMSLPLKSLNDRIPESENVWMSSMGDKYKNRPDTQEFETMCMAEFASTYRVVYGRQKNRGNVLPLKKEMGFIQKRTHGKPAIIRYARFSEKKSSEKFYCTLLKLYLPYRMDVQLKPQGFTTYQDFYAGGSVKLPGSDYLQAVFSIVNENRSKYEKNNESIEKAIEDLEQNGPMEDAWTTLAPESELIRLECISEREEIHPQEKEEFDEVPEYSKSPIKRKTLTTEPPKIDPSVVRRMYQTLNKTQASVFYTVRKWCKERVHGQNPKQFFYFVTGGAGTGKSHVIKCIYTEATKILSKLPSISEETDIYMPTVLLAAFTGTAAFNISGKTLHSILKLPRSLKPPYQGLGNSLDELRVQLGKAEIIIIDEISMVSKSLFAYINWRLQEIKGSKKPFGGMSVLAVGDFYQLPPPGKAKPLCVFEDHVVDYWQDLFHMITLTDIMRQKEDVAFAELLNRMRIKQKGEKLSEEDRGFLIRTVKKPEDCPKNVLHIFATNKEVDQHNATTISSLYSDLVNVDAHDYRKDPQTGRMEKQATPFAGRKGDLPDTIQVAEGARVMLIRNIDVNDGLVNGSFGKIVRIIHQVQHDKEVVNLLGLELDDLNAGKNHRNKISGGPDNLVYIERMEEPLTKKGVTRHQFPMKLAFACTVHKVQGMTSTSAVISLRRIFEPGMAYVALSRTTSLHGLHIIDLDENKIYSDPQITTSLKTMITASFDKAMPLLNCLPDVSVPCLTLIHHNTEGLLAHIDDLKSHYEICFGDILCLTETHLSGHIVPDNIQLDNYQLYKRNRHVSYLNHCDLANRKGGGVAMYVKNHIQAVHMQYLHGVTDLEFLVLKVEAPVQALIAVVYRPPNYNANLFLPNLCNLLDSLEIIAHRPIIVCGDFNEDQLDKRKKPIFECFISRGYTQLITAGTTERNTLLDLVFITCPEHCAHSGVLQSFYSYHEPVFCIVK